MKKQENLNLNLKPVVNKTVLFLLLSLLLSSMISAQNQLKVTGTVTDSDNVPVIGATVMVKGTLNGTVTDVDGKFSLSVEAAEAILSVSYIGYETKDVKVSTTEELRIILKDDNLILDEVVVVGYGSQRKANLTGAVTSVAVDDVEGRALVNAGQVLQGKIPGVSISQNSGRPGDEMSTIRVRGISSIDNNNDPLVIIDGFEGNIDDVNPQDIASISVLRDASSAAIYGSRASAGVILIETHSGSTGLAIRYNGNMSLQQPTRLPETADSWVYAELKNEARRNAGSVDVYTKERIKLYQYGIDPTAVNNDWYDIYFSNAFMHNHHLNASGGNNRFKFNSSISYSDNKGVLIGTESNRLNFNTRLNANFLQDKLRVNMNITGYNRDVVELISPTNAVIAHIAMMTPNSIIHSVDGAYAYASRYLAAEKLGGGITRDQTSLRLNGGVEIEPIKNLIASLALSQTRYREDYVLFSPEFYTTGDYEETTMNKQESELRKQWNITDNNQLTGTIHYSLKLKQHQLNALVGYERLERLYKFDGGQVKELSYNAPIFDFGDPTTHYVRSNANESATASYFSRLNYNFDNRYLLEFNIRGDGSSRFLKGSQWGYFPSFSVGWRLSEESFFPWSKNLDLKLRGSWGRLGNQNIWTYYAASDQMSGDQYYAFGGSVVPGRGTTLLANRNTTWETTEQTNVGLDATLFNRLELTFDYFNKTTFDILSRVTVPPSLGITSNPYQNIGKMNNKGFELNLVFRNKPKKGGFGYTLSGNISYIKNEVVDLGGLEFVNHSDEIRSVVGEPYASFYGYIQDGIWQIDDFTWQSDSDPAIPHEERQYVRKEGTVDQSALMSNVAPGDIKLKDVTGEGLVTPDDKTIIGTSLPDLLYGMNLSFSYRNFGLNILGQGVAGSTSMIAGQLVVPFFNTSGTLTKQAARNRWTYENQGNIHPRVVEDKSRDAIRSTYNLHNSSYFRLKSVELSYTIPSKFTDILGVGRLRLFVTGENLLLITNYLEGFDPERDNMSISAGYHPQVVTYTFGINLSL